LEIGKQKIDEMKGVAGQKWNEAKLKAESKKEELKSDMTDVSSTSNVPYSSSSTISSSPYVSSTYEVSYLSEFFGCLFY
jgi:hypothetical protein